MNMQEAVLLKEKTTMKVGGEARFFVSVTNEDELVSAVRYAREHDMRFFILGGGSNIVVSDRGFNGLVIQNQIRGVVYEDRGDRILVTAGAGENWDSFVGAVAGQGLFGLENLSLIPGTVGAAPVQNIGAYGAEVQDWLISVRVFNTNSQTFEVLSNKECQFAYRDSVFKRNKHLIITFVTFSLNKRNEFDLKYKDIEQEINKRKIDINKLTPIKVREIVTAIRKRKLPDWRKIPTTGSFFKNPEITPEKYSKLTTAWPDLPGFTLDSGLIKVPLAWMIENICGMKGVEKGGAAIYEKHALVIINKNKATARDIESLAHDVKNCIYKKTGVEIEPEVQFIGDF